MVVANGNRILITLPANATTTPVIHVYSLFRDHGYIFYNRQQLKAFKNNALVSILKKIYDSQYIRNSIRNHEYLELIH